MEVGCGGRYLPVARAAAATHGLSVAVVATDDPGLQAELRRGDFDIAGELAFRSFVRLRGTSSLTSL